MHNASDDADLTSKQMFLYQTIKLLWITIKAKPINHKSLTIIENKHAGIACSSFPLQFTTKRRGKKQIKFFLELHKLHVFFANMSSVMLKNNYITFIWQY